MIPPVTTDSVFRVPGIQTTTAGTATTGTATVSLYNAPHQQPPWQRGSSWQPVWQQRTVSQFPLSAVCIPQFPAGSLGLASSSSTNEVERSKSEILELKGYKEDLESYLELARSKIQELEERNEILKSENDFLQAFKESPEARAIIQDLEEKLKEKNCVLEKSQANAKDVIEELVKHTDEFEKAIKENKKLNAKYEMLQGETKEIRNINKKLQDENSSIKCQLELSKSETSEGKKRIQKLEEELEEKNKMNQELSDKIQELNDKIKNEYAEQQRLIKPLEEKILASIEEANETEKIKSELSTSNDRLQKLKNSIASVTGCSTNSSYEDLMDSMTALKRKLDAPEAHSSTLSAQHQEVDNPKQKKRATLLPG
ncbi:hypothetical protein NX722_24405 [Endozoicomonas gorgoniicola]|uniref:Uncharacterized protein n=1 Tax=Endozoicomonas gorgoniicola TaxID=1234144 RepID=A0ABT3N248_9GAMM|nr:hypothetical protein [Endozoicomonas gorgoniicola]MCW7555712.1 hypothetical protein [Endozoicomonas gorgoniicola]